MKKIWPTKKLGEVCEISSGNSAPQKEEYFLNGRFPFFRTSDVGSVHISKSLSNSRDFLNEDGVKGMTLYKKGTILFPKSGASTFLNHRVMMGCGGYVSSHLATIKADNKSIDDIYLFYFLTTIDAKDIAPNSDYPSLKISDISNIEIPLPTLNIQKEIVAKLDKKMKQIKEAKKLREEALADTEKILSQTLREIFKEGRKKGWEKKVLEEVAPIKRKNNQKLLPYVGMENIESNSGVFVGSLEPRRVASNTFYFDKTCVLYGRLRPYLNKVLVPEFEGHCSTEMFPLVPNPKILSRKFLWYSITQKSFIDQAMKTNKGARMPRANMKEVMKFQILIPPLPEQQKIIKRLDALSAKIRQAVLLQKSQLEDLKKLEKAYLREAFNGELINKI